MPNADFLHAKLQILAMLKLGLSCNNNHCSYIPEAHSCAYFIFSPSSWVWCMNHQSAVYWRRKTHLRKLSLRTPTLDQSKCEERVRSCCSLSQFILQQLNQRVGLVFPWSHFSVYHPFFQRSGLFQTLKIFSFSTFQELKYKVNKVYSWSTDLGVLLTVFWTLLNKNVDQNRNLLVKY